MADEIRFNNKQFDTIAQGLRSKKGGDKVRAAIEKLNDAELQYLKGRIRTQTRPKGQQSLESQARVRRLQKHTMLEQGPGSEEFSIFDKTIEGIKDDFSMEPSAPVNPLGGTGQSLLDESASDYSFKDHIKGAVNATTDAVTDLGGVRRDLGRTVSDEDMEALFPDERPSLMEMASPEMRKNPEAMKLLELMQNRVDEVNYWSDFERNAKRTLTKTAMNLPADAGDMAKGVAQLGKDAVKGVAGAGVEIAAESYGPPVSKALQWAGFEEAAATVDTHASETARIGELWKLQGGGAAVEAIDFMIQDTLDLGSEALVEVGWHTPIVRKVMYDAGMGPTDLKERFTTAPLTTALAFTPILTAAVKPPTLKGKPAPKGKGPKVEGKEAPIDLAGFDEVGAEMPMAMYRLREDFGPWKEGDLVKASDMVARGYKVPAFFDRRVGTPAERAKFFDDVFNQLAKWERNNPDMSPAQRVEIGNKMALANRRAMQAADDVPRKKREVTPEEQMWEDMLDERALDPEDPFGEHIGMGPQERAALAKQLKERTEKLQRDAQPGMPSTPEAAMSVVQVLPALVKQSKNALGRVVREGMQGPDAMRLKKALIDELELAMPEMSRKQIKALARANREAGKLIDDIDVPNGEVAWMVDQIAKARAARGQTNTPLTSPNGRYPTTKHDRLMAMGDSLESFWVDEITYGDEAAPLTMHEVYRGKTKNPAAQIESKAPTSVAGKKVQYTFEKGRAENTWYVRSHGYWDSFEQAESAAKIIEKDVKGDGYKVEEVRGLEGRFTATVYKPTVPKNVQRAQAAWELMQESDRKLTPRAELKPDEVSTSADAMWGPEVGGQVGELVAHAHNTPYSGAEFAAIVDALQPAMQSMQNFRDWFRPQFARLAKVDPTTHSLLHEAAGATSGAYVRAVYFNDALLDIFQQSPNGKLKRTSQAVQERSRNFVRFINSEKARALKKRNAAEEAQYNAIIQTVAAGIKLTPEQTKFKAAFEKRGGNAPVSMPELTQMEYDAFYNDPVMMDAVNYWKENVQPIIEEMAPDAGVETFLQTDSGMYAKTVWYQDPKDIAKGTSVYVPGEGSSAWAYSRKRAKAARRQKGVAPEGFALSENLMDVLAKTFKDRYVHATVRRLQDRIVEIAGSPDSVGKVVDFNGQKVKMRNVDLDQPLGTIGDKRLLARGLHAVPEPIKAAYDRIINPPQLSQMPIFGPLVRGWTAAALMIPAEAVMHTLGVFAGVLNQRGLAGKGKIAQGLIDTTIPGRLVGLGLEMSDMKGPQFLKDIQTLADNGGLRVSHFGDAHHVPEKLGGQSIAKVFESSRKKGAVIGATAGAVGGGPLGAGMGAVAGFFAKDLKNWAFGAPLTSKAGGGMVGMETIGRVAMLRAMRRIKPDWTDAQHASHINNQIGTYNQTLQAPLVQSMQAVDPFIRAKLALTKLGVRELGNTVTLGTMNKVSGWQNAMMYGTSIGATMYLINEFWKRRPEDAKKPGDPENVFPWEIPGLKPGDIPIYLEDGRRIDIPFRMWNNVAYRGLNTTGMRTMFEEYVNGERDAEELIDAQIRGVGNFALSVLGPFWRSAGAFLTDRVPYMTSSGDFMDVTAPNTNNPLMDRFQGAIKGAVPVYGKSKEMQGASKAKPESDVGKAVYLMFKMLGMEPALHAPDYELRKAGAHQRAKKYAVRETVTFMIYEMGNLPPEERGEWFRENLDKRLNSPLEKAEAMKMMMQIIPRLPQKYTEGMARQKMAEMGFEDAHVIPMK